LNVRVVACESFKIGRVVGEDQASSTVHRGSDDEGVDGHLAAGSDAREQVAGDASYANSGCDHLGVSAAQLEVDRLIGSVTAVKLNQGGRGYPDRFATVLR
jgi:hypothetical protein